MLFICNNHISYYKSEGFQGFPHGLWHIPWFSQGFPHRFCQSAEALGWRMLSSTLEPVVNLSLGEQLMMYKNNNLQL